MVARAGMVDLNSKINFQFKVLSSKDEESDGDTDAARGPTSLLDQDEGLRLQGCMIVFKEENTPRKRIFDQARTVQNDPTTDQEFVPDLGAIYQLVYHCGT